MSNANELLLQDIKYILHQIRDLLRNERAGQRCRTWKYDHSAEGVQCLLCEGHPGFHAFTDIDYLGPSTAQDHRQELHK